MNLPSNPRFYSKGLLKITVLVFLFTLIFKWIIGYFISGCVDGALAWRECQFNGIDVSLEYTLLTYMFGFSFFCVLCCWLLHVIVVWFTNDNT